MGYTVNPSSRTNRFIKLKRTISRTGWLVETHYLRETWELTWSASTEFHLILEDKLLPTVCPCVCSSGFVALNGIWLFCSPYKLYPVDMRKVRWMQLLITGAIKQRHKYKALWLIADGQNTRLHNYRLKNSSLHAHLQVDSVYKWGSIAHKHYSLYISTTNLWYRLDCFPEVFFINVILMYRQLSDSTALRYMAGDNWFFWNICNNFAQRHWEGPHFHII